MLTRHVLDSIYPHTSNVAHGVEVAPGARLMFANGQVGTRRNGATPESAAEQTEVVFERIRNILEAANMSLGDIARLTVYLTDRAHRDAFFEVRDRVMGDHKPGATILIVAGLARPEIKVEVEVVAAAK
jgi:enamine deaminase RidA (YjgF/YER057c/UK114 family)